jgi:hypothetical protein
MNIPSKIHDVIIINVPSTNETYSRTPVTKFSNLLYWVLIVALLAFISLFIINESSMTRTTYKVQQATFNVDQAFNYKSNNWIVAVMDKNNRNIGFFECQTPPSNTTLMLYYETTKISTLLGGDEHRFYFHYLENCAKSSSKYKPQRKKGEFIL